MSIETVLFGYATVYLSLGMVIGLVALKTTSKSTRNYFRVFGMVLCSIGLLLGLSSVFLRARNEKIANTPQTYRVDSITTYTNTSHNIYRVQLTQSNGYSFWLEFDNDDQLVPFTTPYTSLTPNQLSTYYKSYDSFMVFPSNSAVQN